MDTLKTTAEVQGEQNMVASHNLVRRNLPSIEKSVAVFDTNDRNATTQILSESFNAGNICLATKAQWARVPVHGRRKLAPDVEVDYHFNTRKA
jgi:hypothetical protein